MNRNITTNADGQISEPGFLESLKLAHASIAPVEDKNTWKQDNKEAIKAYNEFVEKNGLFNDGQRSF